MKNTPTPPHNKKRNAPRPPTINRSANTLERTRRADRDAAARSGPSPGLSSVPDRDRPHRRLSRSARSARARRLDGGPRFGLCGKGRPPPVVSARNPLARRKSLGARLRHDEKLLHF